MTELFPRPADFAADPLFRPTTKAMRPSLSTLEFRDELGVGRKRAGCLASLLIRFRRPSIAPALRVGRELLPPPRGVLPSLLHSLRLATSLYGRHFVRIGPAVAVFVAVRAQIHRAVLHAAAFTAWLQMVPVEMFSELSAVFAVASHDGDYIPVEGYMRRLGCEY